MVKIAADIGKLLKEKRLTLGTVESATGGLIASLITDISGSSDYYMGSIISYSNEVKVKIVGVKAATLKKYGAVSAQAAEQMAAGGRDLLKVDICIADTGIAGPTGATADKPVGLFYLGLSGPTGTFSRKHLFEGSRLQNKKAAAQDALEWLKKYLINLA